MFGVGHEGCNEAARRRPAARVVLYHDAAGSQDLLIIVDVLS